ncbi:SusC/RagA family TonB-linked outer membrane protein [Sinomicrobium soli]|uniref:SusC/RagA family TonB-linked outer membrane protein n=1 Tax=Sinomicrobium sp. N-1-3-6 TaxID=2219864 RepID=UPI000DCB2BE9|nr:TonB-dependent receptor [Sinomicrobium sp. N-1-3-6]RAV28244.1 TonB-dependent receptor [Sinomicrobium sp. N-1-3-6]
MKPIKLLLLLFFIPVVGVFAQTTITGTVTDDKGVPIPGANVIVKGSPRGTTTDFDGNYTIDNIEQSDILVYSYIGFQRVEKNVFGQKVINVTLESDEVALDEVVVIGYETVRKKDLTGSVSVIDPEELAVTATSNFDEALAGRAAGVQVTSSDGTPGSNQKIVIRGGNSITGDNSPLYVVDGIPLEGFDPSSLNTRDIESFDILKDASATAIYGSRGANGVIVINTRSGRTDGKTDISIGSFSWIQVIPNRLEVLGPYEFAKYQEKLAYADDSYAPGQNVRQFKTSWVDPELYRNMKGTDWQDEIFRTAYTSNHTLSLRAGNEKTTLYYSGNFLDQEGTLIHTGFRKINNRLKFTHKVRENFKVHGQIDYSKIKSTGLQVSGSTRTSVIRDAVSFRPVDPINWSNDEESVIQDQDPYLYDPVKTLENTDREVSRDVLSGTLGLNYDFLDKFSLTVSGNYRTTTQKSSVFYNEDTQQASRTNRGIHGLISNTRWDILSTSNTLKFNDSKGDHVYGALIGMEAQYSTREAYNLENRNIPTDQFGIDNLGIATTATIAGSSHSANALLSYFGRVNYTYKSRYLATVNFRADGSSKFRKENRWGYFPSFSLAWRVSEEKFMQSVDAVSDLKIRAGWGVTGNNRIGDFEAYNMFSVNTSSGYVLGTNQAFSPGAYQSNMAVPDLRWETTAQTNIGLDLYLFDRLNLTVDFYEKRTTDLLLDADMALSTGFDRVQQNVGEVSNRGIEFALSSQNIRNERFRWETDFNIAFNKTRTEKLNSGQNELLIDPGWDLQFLQTEYQYITRVGHPVGMMYGLEFDGIYQQEDFLQTNDGNYELKEGVPSYRTAMRPGMVKFRDLNGDGIINEDDRTIIGNPQPKHIGGLTNTFTIGSFDFQFLLQWAYDFDILNGNKSEFGSIYRPNRNGLTSLAEIWTPTNTDTDIGGMRFDGVNLTTPYGYKLDTRHIDDGSYLKLKTVVLGYSLPGDILEKFKIKKCRLSISAQNLYTWTNYEGYNPDVSVGRFGALTPRLDYSAYPQSITLSGGIELTF